MTLKRFYTIGAVAPDLLSLDSLNQRLAGYDAARGLIAALFIFVGLIGTGESVQITEAPSGQAPADLELGDGNTVREVYTKYGPGVVSVDVASSELGPGGGSGFVVDRDGHIVTNQHVVEGAETVSIKFSDGSREEAEIIGEGAVAVIFVLALLLGAWTLVGGGANETADDSGGGNGQQNGGSAEQGSAPVGATTPEETTAAPEPTTVEAEPEETTAAAEEEETQASDSGPLPPTQGAADAVYDMYVALPFGNFDESWGYLSERYQGEVGSVAEWEQRYESVSYVSVTSTPQATLDGREARVDFGFQLSRTDGDESVSGTWVCVNEDGEWKLDRLIEN